MHELSLGRAIVETAVRHAAGRPVARVNLRVGALRQVVPETLAFYFDFVSRDTLCAEARLVQQLVPARIRCLSCGRQWEMEEASFRCARCQNAPTEIVTGNEFQIDSIVVEEETACSPA